MMNKKNDEPVAKFFAPFIVLWIFWVMIVIGALGVGIWGFIKLVNHFTS